MYYILTYLYGVNLCYVVGNRTERVCVCVVWAQRHSMSITITVTLPPPCQINRERGDGRQTAEHTEREKEKWREGDVDDAFRVTRLLVLHGV